MRILNKSSFQKVVNIAQRASTPVKTSKSVFQSGKKCQSSNNFASVISGVKSSPLSQFGSSTRASEKFSSAQKIHEFSPLTQKNDDNKEK